MRRSDNTLTLHKMRIISLFHLKEPMHFFFSLSTAAVPSMFAKLLYFNCDSKPISFSIAISDASLRLFASHQFHCLWEYFRPQIFYLFLYKQKFNKRENNTLTHNKKKERFDLHYAGRRSIDGFSEAASMHFCLYIRDRNAFERFG